MVDPEQMLANLRREGARITRQRKAIVEVLCWSSDGLTPHRLWEEGRRKCSDLGLATVYRTVERLERDGYLHRVHEADGTEAFVLSLAAHGHHVLCTNCGRVAEFSTCQLSETIEAARQETGFVISEHRLELLGLCENCAQRQTVSPPRQGRSPADEGTITRDEDIGA